MSIGKTIKCDHLSCQNPGSADNLYDLFLECFKCICLIHVSTQHNFFEKHPRISFCVAAPSVLPVSVSFLFFLTCTLIAASQAKLQEPAD